MMTVGSLLPRKSSNLHAFRAMSITGVQYFCGKRVGEITIITGTTKREGVWCRKKTVLYIMEGFNRRGVSNGQAT